MKANKIDGKIKLFSVLPKTWRNYTNFPQANIELQQQEGFFDVVIPLIDDNIKKLGEIIWDETQMVFTYTVIQKTALEIIEEREMKLNSIDMSPVPATTVKILLQNLAEPLLENTQKLTSQTIEEIKVLYKQYRVGVIYDKDSLNIDEKRFVWNGDLYKVIGLRHTSQTHWTPDTAVSLYVRVTPPGVILAWVQPQGAHNAYQFGSKVTHNGKTWESTVADTVDGKGQNVWEPGVYGWKTI